MYEYNYCYKHNNCEFIGFIAYNDKLDRKIPAVLIAHDWTGRNDFVCKQARMFAEIGYLGFAIDMYGNAKLGNSICEKEKLMRTLLDNRNLLQERIFSAFDELKKISIVDTNKILAIGFCFGGLCVLDLARYGARLQGVVSMHGLLNRPNIKNNHIYPKILILHGYNDPMVGMKDIDSFCKEMEDQNVDWQIHIYGNTKHSFTNPYANNENLGTIYNKKSAIRAFQETKIFFKNIVDNTD